MNETPQQPVDPLALLQSLPEFIKRLTKSEERSMRIERLLMRIAMDNGMNLKDIYTPKQIAWALGVGETD